MMAKNYHLIMNPLLLCLLSPLSRYDFPFLSLLDRALFVLFLFVGSKHVPFITKGMLLFCLLVLEHIMTSYHIPRGSFLTSIWDILLQFLERDDKIFSKEPENLTVKTKFLEDPSTNRNGFQLVKDF